MNEPEWSDPVGGARASTGEPPEQEYLGAEKRAAERLAEEAKAAASSAGARAKDAAVDKAEELRGAAASHLRNFADAVRVAGDDLAAKEPGPISDIVRQAAQGLEQFSGSLERKSPAEMIDGFRNFGRQNPIGFLAGAMLAGFSLARFASSAAPSGRPETGSPPPTGYGEFTQRSQPYDAGGSLHSEESGASGAYPTGFGASGTNSDPDRDAGEAPFNRATWGAVS